MSSITNSLRSQLRGLQIDHDAAVQFARMLQEEKGTLSADRQHYMDELKAANETVDQYKKSLKELRKVSPSYFTCCDV